MKGDKMNLHDALIKMSETHSRMNGKGFSDLLTFHLKERTIKNGNIYLMRDGEIIEQDIKINGQVIHIDNDLRIINEEFYSGLEKRFADYYTSVPDKGVKFEKNNFVCKIFEELTTNEMRFGKHRATARYELEWWVIANAIKGVDWPEGKWFWKSKNYPKLILFKADVKGV